MLYFFFGQVDPFWETNTYFENSCIKLNMTNIFSSSYVKHINTLSRHSKKAKLICLEYFKRKLFHFDSKNQTSTTFCGVLVLNMIMNYMELYIANTVHTIPGPMALIKCFVTSISVNAVICCKHPTIAPVGGPWPGMVSKTYVESESMIWFFFFKKKRLDPKSNYGRENVKIAFDWQSKYKSTWSYA